MRLQTYGQKFEALVSLTESIANNAMRQRLDHEHRQIGMVQQPAPEQEV